MADDLKQFLDSKYPLSQKFRERAPGTFKHSQNVMDFCESVAMELGLDSDLMKVSALYHDIGKLNFPEAFGENQNGTNVHDGIDPAMSYQIITRHVSDGVLTLVQIPEMPRKVTEIISQHHGNTVLRFFFKKSDSSIDDHFRYKCCTPQTIEAAVLMICDSVEAAGRALASTKGLEGTNDKKDLIDTTIQRLVDDDQLDNMRVGELKVVKKVLLKELENIYHKRELYGDEKKAGASGDLKVSNLD